MRKLTIIEHISLDGVIQSPGGVDEDGEGGFRHGGWSAAYADPVIKDVLLAVHQEPFDLLLGRRTYDIWSRYWPTAKGSLFADRFNAATKYIATHRAESLAWGLAESLGPDIAEGVRSIKDKPGRNLILWGSSTLTSVLLGNGLADEVILLVYPVLLGSGKRFFSDAFGASELSLLDTKAGASGMMVSKYKPVGRLRVGAVKAAK